MVYKSGFDAGFNDGYAEAESEQDPTKAELIEALEFYADGRHVGDSGTCGVTDYGEIAKKALEKAKGEMVKCKE